MRRVAVAAVLLACLVGAALAAGPTDGQPRHKTGATSCTEAITKINCIVDPVSKFVVGLNFGYSTATQPATEFFTNCGSAATLTTRSNPATETQTILGAANADLLIQRVEVFKLKGAKNRGTVPLVKFYLRDTANNADFVAPANKADGTPNPFAGLGFLACGDINNAAQYTNVAQNLTPFAAGNFLGYFTTKCAPRALVKEASDPSFALKSIEKPCWAPKLPANAGH